jgi:hypothetical protein
MCERGYADVPAIFKFGLGQYRPRSRVKDSKSLPTLMNWQLAGHTQMCWGIALPIRTKAGSLHCSISHLTS